MNGLVEYEGHSICSDCLKKLAKKLDGVHDSSAAEDT